MGKDQGDVDKRGGEQEGRVGKERNRRNLDGQAKGGYICTLALPLFTRPVLLQVKLDEWHL